MLKVIQLGLGPIGQQLTRFLSEREGITIVAAVDPAEDKAGKDLGELCGSDKMGVLISSDIATAMKNCKADVAVISTVSSLECIENQIKDAADHHLHMVTTCEEMSHPWQTHTACADRIHKYCIDKGVTCLATGVNPGFLMDFLPAAMTSICRNVDHVKVERFQNAAFRRLPFQQKIGADLSPEEFENKRESLKHVGLPESVYMIAAGLNWKLDKVEERIDPIFAETDIQNGNGVIPRGKNLGVHQTAVGYINGQEKISLVFHAAVGVEDPHDSIEIKGEPSFRSTIPGGLNGDIATSAIIVNALRSVMNMQPGLRTMLEAPAPAWFSKVD